MSRVVRAFGRRTDETMQSWAIRLLTDPLLDREPMVSIAELSGCPRELLAAAQDWLDATDPGIETARRIAADYELSCTAADVIRDALLSYEIELSSRTGCVCIHCGAPPRQTTRKVK